MDNKNYFSRTCYVCIAYVIDVPINKRSAGVCLSRWLETSYKTLAFITISLV